MLNEVNDDVFETGTALILNGEIMRLVQMIEVELSWLPNKESMVTELKKLALLGNAQDANVQRQAVDVWALARGTTRTRSRAERIAVGVGIAYVGLGALGGIIYLFRLIL